MNNINYGNNSLTTKYLQYFLRDNYSDVMKMSWNYDEYTHQKLLEYLDTPNYISSNDLLSHLKDVVAEINTSGYESLTKPFSFMQNHIEENTVVFFAKNPLTIEGYSDSDYPLNYVNPHKIFKALIPVLSSVYNEVNEYCIENGWRIAEYPDLFRDISTLTDSELEKINELESITVVLKTKTPTNVFPHYDLRYMVNYFNNTYVNNYNINNNLFQKSGEYRVALIKCNPGDTFIISHGYTYSIPIKVGYSTSEVGDVIDTLYTAKNITALKVQGMDVNNLDKFIPGIPMMVTVPKNNEPYKTLLIVIPKLKYSKTVDIQTQTPLSFTDSYLMVGDLNNDGVIDEIDRLIYACQRPQDFGLNDVVYFNYDYSRYKTLCECVEEKYNKLFLCNGEEKKYNNSVLGYFYDANNNKVNNIDNIVKHLEFLCNGTDITFQRYLINGDINYRIIIGNTMSAKNMSVLTENNVTTQTFDLYLNDTSVDSTLKYYIFDTGNGYGISKYPVSSGTNIICGNNMTSNNILVIKSNPYDELDELDEPCYKIIYGSHNTEDNLSLPISDFKNNAWMVRTEFISAILDYLTNPYSNQEDIAYLYKLIQATNEGKILSSHPYIYTDKLKDFIRDLQLKIKSPFSLGYANGIVYDTLFSDAYNNYVNGIVGG